VQKTLKERIKSSRVLSRLAWAVYREVLVYRSNHPRKGTIPDFSCISQLVPLRLSSFEQFQDWSKAFADELERQGETERLLSPRPPVFSVSGACALCGSKTEFRCDFSYGVLEPGGQLVPNFRETLIC
jgi:hypothetical protein